MTLVKIWRGTDLGAGGQELNLEQVGLRCLRYQKEISF